MALVSIEDFKTHLRDYVIEAISDNDQDILTDAIDRATATAKSYLSNYDIDAIFSTTDPQEKQIFADLIGYIKDIAKWHFIALSNVLTDWDVAKENYKNAIAELGKIQSGKSIPAGWPLAGDQIDTGFVIDSRPKRGNSI